jgi:3-ketosteroid 9alpha-monooxygenase subunit A
MSAQMTSSDVTAGQSLGPSAMHDRYARGWHCLGLAKDYKDGKPHKLDIFGTRLVAFRGEDDVVHILDAYCPHMGADFSIGCVRGNSVVCRFHGWAFGGDGSCSGIPYAKRIPPKARVKSWPTLERNRLLFIWNDAEGGSPDMDLAMPELPQLDSPDWSDWSMRHWTIHNNCRELVDNLSDVAHFGPVHGSSNVVYFANLFDGPRATQVMIGTNERLGGTRNYLKTVATYIGPACLLCSMHGEADGVPAESVLCVTHVPIDHDHFDLRYGVLVKKRLDLDESANAAMVQAYTDLAVKAFAEDVEIWHNKVRVDNPLLCAGDGPIYQLRAWYEQFYMDKRRVPAGLGKRSVVEIALGLVEKPVVEHVFGI